MTDSKTKGTWLGAGFLVGLVAALLVAFVLGMFFSGEDRSADSADPQGDAAPEARAERAASTRPGACDLGVVVARRVVDVAAQTEGTVEAIEVAIGDSVEAGDVLARLDVRLLEQDLAAERAALEAARAEAGRRRVSVRRAEAESARRRSLADVVSEEEIARAAAELEEVRALVVVAEAEIERLQARIERLETILDRAKIRAPFAGRIAARYLDPGARAAVGTPIVRLISDGDLRVRFAASPERAAALTAGESVRVEVPERDVRVAATVEQVAPEIDPASRRVFVEARLDDPADLDRLRAGEVVRVTEPDAAPCRPEDSLR